MSSKILACVGERFCSKCGHLARMIALESVPLSVFTGMSSGMGSIPVFAVGGYSLRALTMCDECTLASVFRIVQLENHLGPRTKENEACLKLRR